MATFLLTCETRGGAIIAHHLRTLTSAIQLVDAPEPDAIGTLRAVLPTVGMRLVMWDAAAPDYANPPPEEIVANAHVQDFDSMYRYSIEDPQGFWADRAPELEWFQKWDKVLDWKAPFARWFDGGKLNVCEPVAYHVGG